MSSVGALAISIGSLFQEMGSHKVKTAFLRQQTKTAVAQLATVSSKVSLRWRLKQFLKATVEYFADQDEVSVKPATLK